jgi:hypothetical protein
MKKLLQFIAVLVLVLSSAVVAGCSDSKGFKFEINGLENVEIQE